MSQKPSNREIGQAWTAFILGELFEEWPRKVDFNAMDLATATGLGPVTDEEEMFDGLFDWLRDEGFVRFEQRTEGNVYAVTLTKRGIDVLRQNLGVDLKEPLGSKLRSMAKSAGSQAGRAAIGEAIGQVIGAAMRAMTC